MRIRPQTGVCAFLGVAREVGVSVQSGRERAHAKVGDDLSPRAVSVHHAEESGVAAAAEGALHSSAVLVDFGLGLHSPRHAECRLNSVLTHRRPGRAS